MTYRLRLLALLLSSAILAAICLPARAQSPLVHLSFDGSVENSGPAGGAMLVVPDGADQPVFVEGQFGQAISFGKGGAVAIPYDFDQKENPRATITMWVKVDAESSNERELFSLGPGNGLLLTLTSRRQTNVRSGRQTTHAASIPVGEWVFVATVVDNQAGTIRIHQNDDIQNTGGLDIRSPHSLAVKAPAAEEAEHFIFVGADDFKSAGREVRHVALDDVRLYPDALDTAQIASIRNARAAAGPALPPGSMVNREIITDLPRNVRRPLPDATIDDPAEGEGSTAIGETEKNLSTPPGLPTPDSGLKPPEGLPGEEIAKDIEQARSELPAPEPMDEIQCKGQPDGNPVFSSNGGKFPPEFTTALKTLMGCGERATVAAINASGQWIAASRKEIAHSRNLPDDLIIALRTYEQRYGGLDAADIADNGVWVIINGSNYKQRGVTSSTETKLKQLLQTGGRAAGFDFAPGGASKWALVSAEGGVTGEGLSSLLTNALEDMVSSKRKARNVSFGPSDELVLLADGNWFTTENAHRVTREALRKEQLRGKQTDLIVFSDVPGQYITYSTDEAERPSDPIYIFEHGFQQTSGSATTVPATIWERMEANNLKAVSIAMIRGNRVVWTRGYGLLNANDPQSYVYTDSTFDVASLSKPLAAFGLMQLVDIGKLSLTDDGIMEDAESLMSSSQKTAFQTNVGPSDGNLLQLLQHCAGICYRNTCAGGAAEYDLNTTLPSTADMIVGSGAAKSANRLRRARAAGVIADYTSANFMMLQALIEVHGGGFLAHMEPLLDDLEMIHSTYKSPYELRNGGNFARGWTSGSVADIPAYGEMAAASLVSTPTDYSKFMIAMNKLAEGEVNDDLLSQDMFNKYLGRDSSIYSSKDYGTCASPGPYALGIEHYTSAGDWGGIEYFRHRGSHNGYRARMDGFPAHKGGLVVFMTGERGDADNFHAELRTAIMAAYDLTKP